MSGEQPATAAPVSGIDRSTSTPSIHVVRARRLLLSGLLGGGIAAVLSVGGLGLLYGAPGIAGALLGAVMVLVFYTVGQLVMVAFADAGARTLLLVSMASYTARVVVLGLLLLLYNAQRDQWPTLTPIAVFVSAIAVVAGWLALEVWTFSRLRIGVYDTEYTGPAASGDGR